MATSREGLRVAGESTYLVPPLSLPERDRLPPPEGLMQFEAVRLFAARAAFNRPGFTVTDNNAPAVAKVCRRLDGMPLAIELAAARVRVLAVEQIAARLDDRFRLLTGGSRTVLPRHQTLRAAMDWSYDLLSEPERALFRRLSVFAGGWTLEAAEAICPGEGIEAAAVLDLLTSLVDKSLVLVETRTGEARYRLLETIRQYSRNRQGRSGEAATVQRRHRDWYLALAERAEAELRGPRQETWLERLEVEHDNLRAALEWSAGQPATDAEMRLAGALRWF
jgi:non-specific serine/threonine protein kinase